MNESILNSGRGYSRRSVLAGVVGVGLAGILGPVVGLAQEGTSTPAASPSAGATKFNLNLATEAQFRTIPGVGDRFVREFQEYRPYTSIVQFRQEIGKYVDEKQVATWEKSVFVPVDPEKADAETLKQLPGVTDDIVKQLIGGRPYASADAFLAALGKHVTADQAKAARAYLATTKSATAPAAGTPAP
jgi:DNA uptake protein ComE-like DNA-binding protein